MDSKAKDAIPVEAPCEGCDVCLAYGGCGKAPPRRRTLVELGEVPAHAADPYPCRKLAKHVRDGSRGPELGAARAKFLSAPPASRASAPLALASLSLQKQSQAEVYASFFCAKPATESQARSSLPPWSKDGAAFGRGFPGVSEARGEAPGPGFGAEPHRNALPSPGLAFLLGVALGVLVPPSKLRRSEDEEASPESLSLRAGVFVGGVVRESIQEEEAIMADAFKLKGGPVQKLTDTTKGWKEAPGTAWAPHKLTAAQAGACKYLGKRVLDGAAYGVFEGKKGEHFARPMAELMK